MTVGTRIMYLQACAVKYAMSVLALILYYNKVVMKLNGLHPIM